MLCANTRPARAAAAVLLLLAAPARAQEPFGSAFSYQGRLTEMGGPANGTYDIRFGLFDAATGGTQLGQVTANGLSVAGGLFTADLDFGPTALNGSNRWLEIAVQSGGGGFQTLSPRQRLTGTPYAQAIHARTVVVKPVGIPPENGAALVAALNGITSASPINRWLVKIEPGIYVVQPGALQMKPFVDMEGSGEDVTVIVSAGTPDNATGTLLTADSAELRFLTVENTGGNTYAKPIYVHGTSPTLSHVTARSSGATLENQGIFIDEVAGGTNSPVIKDATIVVIGDGTANSFGLLSIGAVFPTVSRVSSTALFGNFVTAFWNYFAALTLTDVVGYACCATASEGMTSVGSNVTVVNSQVYGGSPGSGMSAVAGTVLYLRNVSVTGGDNGVFNDSSNMEIRGSGVLGTVNGVTNVAASGTYFVQIDDSTIRGQTRTINSTPNFNIRVGASKLDGPIPAGGASQACVFTYNAAYLPLTTGCN